MLYHDMSLSLSLRRSLPVRVRSYLYGAPSSCGLRRAGANATTHAIHSDCTLSAHRLGGAPAAARVAVRPANALLEPAARRLCCTQSADLQSKKVFAQELLGAALSKWSRHIRSRFCQRSPHFPVAAWASLASLPLRRINAAASSWGAGRGD